VSTGGEADDVVAVGADRDAYAVVPRPALLERVGTAARVTLLSAPAGSGKTVLLRSWIREPGVTGNAAWVPAGREESDSQGFWLSVLGALRATGPGSRLVQAVSAAPALDGWALVERLLHDLAALRERLWLVIDDAHELGSSETLRQLELLVMRGPPELRFVLATRHDLRLGLHRLRLEGGLSEIRADDLRFTFAEAAELLATAGVELPFVALGKLHERTEGWAAGLRLAALSLAGHPEPERFADEFSGSERTVAEYLLAEVLDRQPEPVRRLLLRTSILDSVNGELADLLTGAGGGERRLQDLEAANAFVVALDAGRSWFRYHRLFSDLLQLELRRAEPDDVTGLHRQAAEWFAAHGHPVQSIQHAQAARDWHLAARLLADHWPGFHLDGQAATVHALLAGFPGESRVVDAELAVLSALDELTQGSLEEAERYLGVAERASSSMSTERRGQAQLLLGIGRLLQARQRGNLPAVVEEARRLQGVAEVPGATRFGSSDDLRALALITLGSAEYWAGEFDPAERHLEPGLALARRIGRPYLEFTGLAYLAAIEIAQSFARATAGGIQAFELAQRHGWTDDPAAGIASGVVGAVLAWQGKPEEAEPWVQRAERALRAEAEPAGGLAVRTIRGMLELGRSRDADALAAFRAADRLAARLAGPNHMVLPNRSLLVQTLVRLGETERAEKRLAELDDRERDSGEMRISLATLRLAQHNPADATDALAPILDGSAPRFLPGQSTVNLPEFEYWGHAFLLEAIARDALGDSPAAGRALERALDVAEPDGVLVIFLLSPAPGLLARHARQGTAHAALVADTLNLLAGRKLAPQPDSPEPLLEALSDSEIRVLRYLPTNLTGPEIAGELYVSMNTVRTHMRHLYEKLGTHTRADAVARGRALGMLAPSPQSAGQTTRVG
jgi:LuxR family maltose regulon positive regulatory protein